VSEADDINHCNQMNPDHDAYWQSRGYDERPEGAGSGGGDGEDWERQWMAEEE
jgi:hypothetical protein